MIPPGFLRKLGLGLISAGAQGSHFRMSRGSNDPPLSCLMPGESGEEGYLSRRWGGGGGCSEPAAWVLILPSFLAV